MTFSEAITGLMSRPDCVALLDPSIIVSINRAGLLVDETKPYKAYPRLRAQDCMAITWQVLTRQQVEQRAAEIEAQLQAAGVLNGHQ